MKADSPEAVGREVDKRFAFVVTFVPPLTFIFMIYLHFADRIRVSSIEVLICASMFALSLLGVELGFHRLFSHRTYVPRRYFKIAVAVLGSMAFQGPVIWWAGIHRKHHRFSDIPGDPHSMYLDGDSFADRFRGFVHAQFGWIWKKESIRFENLPDYVLDLYRDPDIFWIHVNYAYWMLLGLVVPAILGGILHQSVEGAVLGFIWGGPIRIFFMNHLTFWAINTVGHGFGYRSFETPDESTNNWLLGVLTFGQGFHNNHHAFPNSYRMGHHWWEIDIGTLVLNGAVKLKWVSTLKDLKQNGRYLAGEFEGEYKYENELR